MFHHLLTGLIISLALTAGLSDAQATEPSSKIRSKYSLRLRVGGNFFAGNLNQVQTNGRVHHAYNSKSLGYDMIVSGFRVWTKPKGTEDYLRIGDDLYMTALPFWYFHEKFYLMPVVRYESSQLYKLDHRISSGLNVGMTPVRTPNFLIRVSLGSLYEYNAYESADFRTNIDVANDDEVLQGMKLSLFSNGWFRIKKSPLSFRYLFAGFMDPTNPGNVRGSLDASLSIKVIKPISLQVSSLLSYRSVGIINIEPFDVRSTFGISLNL